MSSVSVEDIAKDPAAFVGRLRAGESLLLTSGDQTVAEVTPVLPTTRRREPRPYGLAAGEFVVPENFNEPLPADILDAFEDK